MVQNEKFLKITKEYGELNCIDKLTPEEIREMQLRYRQYEHHKLLINTENS